MNNSVELNHFKGFSGNALIKMADNSDKKVSELKKGDFVLGNYKVKCIIKSFVNEKLDLIDINSLLISPMNLIFVDSEWIYPKNNFLSRKVNIDILYNIVLETGEAIILNNIHVLTLGHYISTSLDADENLRKDMIYSRNLLNYIVKNDGWEDGNVILNEPLSLNNLFNSLSLNN